SHIFLQFLTFLSLISDLLNLCFSFSKSCISCLRMSTFPDCQSLISLNLSEYDLVGSTSFSSPLCIQFFFFRVGREFPIYLLTARYIQISALRSYPVLLVFSLTSPWLILFLKFHVVYMCCQ